MRKKAIASIATVGLVCACVGGALSQKDTLSASGETAETLLVTELFSPDGMVLEPMSQDGTMQILDKGLMLFSDNTKNVAEWKNECVGDFSFTYLPTQTGSSYTAQALEITFTDTVDGDSFTLVVEHGQTMNAYVRFENVSAGIYYMNKKQLDFTSFCNEDGAYTQFSATKIGVQFDPSTMCVYAGDAAGALSLVWDLTKETNDGRNVEKTLNPFEKYTVSFAMPAFAVRSGSVILYEVNGCPFDGLFVRDSGKPSVFANVELNALIGQAYTLPQGVGYDVLDGELDTEWEVYNPSGERVAMSAATFTPTAAGEYTLSYTAMNARGTSTTREYAITAYGTQPNVAYEIDGALNDEYVLNEQVSVPKLWISGGLRRYGKTLGTLTVEKDGAVFAGYENKESGFDFTFTQTGEYAFVYDVNGEELRYNVLVNGAASQFVTEGLQSTYAKNTILDCRDFKVLVDGEETPFTFSVKFPDGKRYQNKKFQVNVAGKYELLATAKVGEKAYAFKKSFTVSEDYTDYFLPLHGATVENGVSSYTQKEGVVVTTTHSGALVEYTQPIDISKYVNQRNLTYDDSGEIVGIKLKEDAIPLIEFTVDPDVMNVRAANEVYIYLTDAANPDNVLTINARTRADYAAITTGASGQSLKGFMNLKATAENATSYIDGQYGSIEAYGGTGFRVWHTFDGLPAKEMRTGESVVSLYYDNEAKQLLSYPGLDGGNTDAKNHVIMDYDDSRYLQADMPWGGFESNTVYLSMAVSGLTASQAKSCIYTVDGRRLAAETDESVPTIRVNESEVLGLKGYSVAIPQATASDCGGNALKTLAKAYFVKDGNRFDVTVQNGRFKTDYSGTYHIVYTATDAFGRRSEKTVTVSVMETYADLTAVWEEPTAEYTDGKIAGKLPLYDVENVTVSGAIGALETERKIYFGAEEVAFEGWTFTPQKAGVYTVEYTFTDSVGRTARLAYTIDVAVPSEPVIASALPTYVGFIRGNSYTVADVYFIDYKQSETQQKADVYINGTRFTGAEYAVEDKVEGKKESQQNETLRLEYRYGNVILKGYDIPVITVNKMVDKKMGAQTIEVAKLFAERYFLTDENTSVTAQKTHFTLKSNDNAAKIAFAQPIQANGLQLVMDIDQAKNGDLSPVDTNLKSVKLYLTDASDLNKSIFVELQTNALTNKVNLCINGEDYSAAFAGSLVGAAVELIRLRYNDGYFYDANGDGLKLVAPTRYANGEPFKGFGDLIYVSFALVRADETKETALRLYSVNGQQLTSDLETDAVNPTIATTVELGGVYEQGDTIDLAAVQAYDVLSGIKDGSLTLTVSYTSGGNEYYAKDTSGQTLQNVSAKIGYTLQLNETGAYKAVYTVSDGKGNTYVKTFTFEVMKHQKSVITLKGDLPTSVKAGSVVEVPLADVAFADENEKNLVWVVCISPSTNTYTLMRDDDMAFYATELGDYVIRYCALDVYGAYTIVEYVVNSHL